ncbi:MAG: glycoside hydrolase family 2, partial [Tannerella sp.]|nr:glycoside hydrolase family 2 [Tannerella sp.]
RSEFFFFVNAHLHREHHTRITFPKAVTSGKYPWVWDSDTGKRYRIELLPQHAFDLYLGPADSRIIVFDGEEKGEPWHPLPVTGRNLQTLEGWDVELRHSIDHSVKTLRMNRPIDLKETEHLHFTGTAIYRKNFRVEDAGTAILNLGKVYGISEVRVNGRDCGVTWYGNRLYDLSDRLKSGDNTLEIHVITTMGNCMKTFTGNKAIEWWVSRPGRIPQPDQSMGLVGPVTLYAK